MAKQGFNGQWIEICRTGQVTDSAGIDRNLDASFFEQVVKSFQPNEAPAVIGHPKENAPAYGWATALKFSDGSLWAQFGDTDDEFEKMVAARRFKNRSASFYLKDGPRLRHVGFLGAQPPAVKGLRDIQFTGGDAVTVEISFSEEPMADKPEEKMTAGEWFRSLLGGGNPAAPPTASFSAADAERIAAETAAKTEEKLRAEFAEAQKKADAEILELRQQVQSQATNSKHAEIVSFVESLGADKCPPWMKRVGLVEFLESLAVADAADKELAVVCFSEGEGGKRTEHKFSRLDWAKNFFGAMPAYIQFGEQFGDMAVGDMDLSQPNPKEVEVLRAGMGLKIENGGEKK
jgi:hypothetical protein